MTEMLAQLHDVSELLDDYQDVVDGDYGEPRPNRAMSMKQDVDALVDRIEHTWQKRRTWFQERCWSHGNMTAYHLRQIPDDKDDFARKWTNANAYAEAREAGHYGALALAAGADPYQRDPADEVFDDVTF